MYWDERDHYNRRQKELIEELGAERFGNSICITEMGTVYTTDGFESKEVSFDNFIKNTEKRIKKEKHGEKVAIKYDKQGNKFYFVETKNHGYYKSTLAHELDINEEIMNDYAFGKYNHITSSLHNLYLKSMDKEEAKNLSIKREEEIKEIILKTQQGHELPTLAEAETYLNYLEASKRDNNKTIMNKSAKLAGLVSTPLVSALGTGLAVITSLNEEMLIEVPMAGIAGFVGAFSVVMITDALFMEKTSYWDFSDYIKKTAGVIKEKCAENNVINTKIAALNNRIQELKQEIVSKSYDIQEFDKTIEDEELKSLNLKNSIMSNIDDLVNRINLLNPEDKQVFLKEVQEILTEYTEGYVEIVNRDENVINITANNLDDLKSYILARIAILEMNVNEVRQKDVKIKTITDESKLLTDKIEGFSDFDLDLQRTHEITQNKVKVKKLVREDMSTMQKDNLKDLLLELNAE